MSTIENAGSPVRAELYEHQISAYLFVLRIFDAIDEGGKHGDYTAARKDGDAMNISNGKGAALLMEMG